MQQPVADFKTAARLAALGAAQEPVVGHVQVDLPLLHFVVADFFFVEIAQGRGRLLQAALEGLLVILGRTGIGDLHTLAEIILLAQVEPGRRAALQRRHA
ncbi:hypothetical protein D3C79_687280 [compost metagenome]